VPLTDKQARFVEEYLVDLNATQAAIRAGYSRATANEQGSRLLANVSVSDAIAAAQAERSKRTQINADWVLERLARIADADIRNVVQWGEAIAVKDDAGGDRVVQGIALVDAAELAPEHAFAITEVSQTKEGLKVKLADKRAALVDIGRHLGMFVEKAEITGKDGGPLQIVLGADDEKL
jgi:phage terminase small subunit